MLEDLLEFLDEDFLILFLFLYWVFIVFGKVIFDFGKDFFVFGNFFFVFGLFKIYVERLVFILMIFIMFCFCEKMILCFVRDLSVFDICVLFRFVSLVIIVFVMWFCFLF